MILELGYLLCSTSARNTILFWSIHFCLLFRLAVIQNPFIFPWRYPVSTHMFCYLVPNIGRGILGDLCSFAQLCKIAEGQRYSKKLNDRQVTALLKATCQRPPDRERSITEAWIYEIDYYSYSYSYYCYHLVLYFCIWFFLNNLVMLAPFCSIPYRCLYAQMVRHNNYNNDIIVNKEFGIQVRPELTSIEARVLPAPTVDFPTNIGCNISFCMTFDLPFWVASWNTMRLDDRVWLHQV